MDRIANADQPEIEVTPEMVEAGVIEILKYDPELGGAADLAASVFRAMWMARLEGSAGVK